VAAFEQAFESTLGVRNCLATCSGTAAIDLCLRGLQIGDGDEVLVPARSYVSAAMAVRRAAATVRLVDAEPESGNVTAETLEAACSPRSTAAVVVHIAGWPCDMEGIMAWSARRGIRIIEDCAQAHGAQAGGQAVGSFGHAAAFSMCQDKILSTGGEGGMACFRESDDAARAWSWRDHGKSRGGAKPEHGPALGTNLRMTGVQAAIGRVQLPKLADWSARRRRNALTLRSALCGVAGIDVPWSDEATVHACYMLVAQVRSAEPHIRDRLVSLLAEAFPVRPGTAVDIAAGAPWFDSGQDQPPTPVADALANSTVLLPVHPTAGDADMRRLAAAIEAATIER